MPNTIKIYTDGSCLGNPGKGGYAAVLKHNDKVKEISAGYRLTTNNRMEFLAAIEALKSLKKRNMKIELYTDSNLLTQTIEKGWLKSWKSKGWRKADKKTPENLDLLKQLDEVIQGLDLKIIWIKAHNGHPENERCDELAKEAAYNADLIDTEYEKNKPFIEKVETKSPDKSNKKSKTNFELINNKLIIQKDDKEIVLTKTEINKLSKLLTK
jgi:ribonuclease HI